jgi:hypothetical protein
MSAHKLIDVSVELRRSASATAATPPGPSMFPSRLSVVSRVFWEGRRVTHLWRKVSVSG